MNKRGFISTASLYSFFLVFCLLLILIVTTYANNRIGNKEIIKDAKKYAYEKYTEKYRFIPKEETPIINDGGSQ